MTVWRDADFPADPYPGAQPPGSFLHAAGLSIAVTPGPDLDAALAERGAAPVAARVPVLAYGSNRCPSKITWMRETLGLGADPVVVLAARTHGLAAVWACGLRPRDGQRPAVLAAAPGIVEDHAVWLATPEQIEALDRCEGNGVWYQRVRLRTGRVELADSAPVPEPLTYVGLPPRRLPLTVDGAMVRCAVVAQDVARILEGRPGPGDGLSVR